MTLRLIHISDVHLGCKNYYLGDRAGERSDEFKASFRDVVEFALAERNRIHGVVIAGNLFEQHRPDPEIWSFTRGLISRLLAKDILVAVCPGHHDSYAYKNSVWRTERLPGVELFLNTAPEAPRVREMAGTRVFLYGLAYVPGQTPNPLPAFEKAKEGGVHVGVLHAVTQRHPEFADRPHQLEIDLENVAAAGLDYVALGGFKTFAEYEVGSSKIVWSGSLEGRGFEAGETGEKGPVVVEFDERGVHIERRITQRKLISRVQLDLRKEKITDAAGLKNAITALADRNAIVQLILTGTAEFVASLDEIRLETIGQFHHLEVIDQSKIVDSALLRKIESENTIRGYFVRKLLKRVDAAKAKIAKTGATPETMRELRVAEAAMKMGIEQFVEEETPQDSIYAMIPDSNETVAAEEMRRKAGIAVLEDRVKTMMDDGSSKNGHANGMNGKTEGNHS